ncbi:MAG: aldehyde ferredoxin oxidoreductase family protein [Thermodesulfobacteriota bacterium]
MAGGFIGRYGVLNLSTGEFLIRTLEEAFYRKFLGGYGLGAAVICREQAPGVEPLSPESWLGFCPGLLTGTGALFSGRFMVMGKSPLTGGWGDANAGGFFSGEIKKAGYDGIFITGAAERPVWVLMTRKGAEIREAGSLWGMDAIETGKGIRKASGDGKVQVVCIGEGGERCSLISGIVTGGGRIAARSGLGAVMGSKKLKAIAVRGDEQVPVHDPDGIREINRLFLEKYKKISLQDRLTVRFMHSISRIIALTGIPAPAKSSTLRQIYRRYGTSGLTVYSAMTGDMPIKNWKGAGNRDYPLDRASRLSDDRVVAFQKKRYSCQGCPLGCGGIVDLPKGRFEGKTGHKPEYETLAAFGGLMLHDNLEAVMEINEMCNRAGIDTISAGAAVAFAIDCFENGLIGESDTGGLKLGWGKSNEIMRLVEMIIRREGIGDVLADGVMRAAGLLGKETERFALHAGGQEIPMHDSRLDPGYAVAYQCEPTPGRHTISCNLYPRLFGVKHQFPENVRKMIKSSRNKSIKNVRLQAAGSIYTQILNGAGICLFGALTGPLPLVDFLNAATGWGFSPDEYWKTGLRILSLRKAFNVREGIRGTWLPDAAVGNPPLDAGPLKGITIKNDSLVKEFFETLEWDLLLGGPTEKTLNDLELQEIVHYPE